MIDYFKIIHKYIPPESLTYRPYIIHVTLVTNKALKIANKLGLNKKSCDFIEEAGMLHDIGIIRTRREQIHCYGNKPYICHNDEGKKILIVENLPKHARVAYNHIAVGLFKEDIISREIPLPHEDIFPETLEEEIISYADLFYSKNPNKLWEADTFEKIEKEIRQYGEKYLKILYKYQKKFNI